MPFETTCPHCGCVHAAMPDSASGAMVRCRECFKPFTALALASSGGPSGSPRPGAASDDAGRPPGAGAAGERLELRTVVARLTDIQRKCGALVARHPELAELAPTLDLVLRDLRVGHGPRGEPLGLRELALPLGSWARRLDRLELPALARELAHVERVLNDAADAQPLEEQAEPEVRERDVGRRTESAARSASAPADPPPRRLRVVVGAGAAVTVAVAAVLLLVVLRRPASSPQLAQVTPEPTMTPARTSPTPRASATPGVDAGAFQLSSRDLTTLVGAASQAQLAAQRGDLESALGQLDIAAHIDPTRAEVRAAAEAVVEEMLARAGKDEAEGRFDEAENQLLQAQRVSERFVLDPQALDAHLSRLRSAERTVRIRASEVDRLRGAVGRQVELRLVGRESRRGLLTAVEGDTLVLEVHDALGSGEVAYTVRVPLTKVELVVYRYKP